MMDEQDSTVFEEEFESLLMTDEMGDEFEDPVETKIVTLEINGDRQSNKPVIFDEESKNQLYHCFNLPSDHFNRNFGDWRLDVVHIRGVHEMSSEDVLSFFSQHDPSSIEWVNDLSCNVVFETDDMAAKAISDLTTALVIKGEKLSELNFPADVEVIDGDTIEISIPPGRWRLGKKHQKAELLLLRFASFDDRKVKGARKFSQYYFKYGYGRAIKLSETELSTNENLTELHEEISQNPQEVQEQLMPSKRSEKFFRMRMRADDEEVDSRSKSRKGLEVNVAHNLDSITRQVTDYSRKGSIWDRLDTRVNHQKKNSIWNRLDKPDDDLRMKINRRRSQRGTPY